MNAKKTPIIYTVIPDDLKRAFVAFLNRDRKFSDTHFYKTHSGSRKTLLWIAQNNPAVRAYIYAVEKGKKDQHVLPQEKGWIVKNLLSNWTSQIFDTKHEALKYAESHANQGTAIFVHSTSGFIVDRKDY
ncbi:MAG: DUF2188 domain-containing protein [Patescibacteria group bacterium]|nr:DUF2188 domain-containing protein [Patescibacteria group bacterium]MDE2589523.1 DUF2188 domain-containing protein [Patescibacteria group bacterium]